jgi:N-acetylglucosaminyldiphosphoundecaprenol N-acetyl-beta-D-mannosaminyltransferase
VVASHSPAARDSAVQVAVDRAVANKNARTQAAVASGSPSEPAVVSIGTLQIHDVAVPEADRILRDWLDEARDGRSPRRGRYACTPNVDYVVRAGRDPAFRRAINSADMRVPDGMWIVYASRLAGRPLRGTVTGRLLLPRFAAHCAAQGLSIGLLGAGPGVAQEAARRLRDDNPGLTIDPVITPPMPFGVGSPEDEAIVSQLTANPPAMLFVSLGAPKQELWMERHSAELPATVMVGVGAALDVIAGRVREAPAWMTRVGLEWLFRLVQEPRRLARRYLRDDPSILVWAIRTRLGRNDEEGEGGR